MCLPCHAGREPAMLRRLPLAPGCAGPAALGVPRRACRAWRALTPPPPGCQALSPRLYLAMQAGAHTDCLASLSLQNTSSRIRLDACGFWASRGGGRSNMGVRERASGDRGPRGGSAEGGRPAGPEPGRGSELRRARGRAGAGQGVGSRPWPLGAVGLGRAGLEHAANGVSGQSEDAGLCGTHARHASRGATVWHARRCCAAHMCGRRRALVPPWPAFRGARMRGKFGLLTVICRSR